MKNPFSSSIGGRISGGFLVLLVLLLAISWIANTQMKSIEELVSRQVIGKATARRISQDILLKNLSVSGYVKEYLLAPDYAVKKELGILIHDELRTMREEMTQVRSDDLADDEKTIVDRMEEGFSRYSETITGLMKSCDSNGPRHPETMRLSVVFSDIQSHFLTHLLRFDAITAKGMYGSWDDAVNRLSLIKTSIFILSIAAVAAVLLLSYFATRSITRPISRLMDVLERYAGGEHSVRSDIVRDDEIGFFALRFNSILDQLQASHQRLLDIIDFLPDPTFVIDGQGRVTAWNRAMEDITGVPGEQVLGRGDYCYAVPFYGRPVPILIDLVFEAYPDAEKRYSIFERKPERVSGETFVEYPSGGSAWLYGTASPLFDSEGHVVGAIESLRDITRQKLSEMELRESEERFRTLAASAQDAIIILDNDGLVSYWNDAASRIFGYSAGEISGHDVHMILAPGDYHESFRSGFEQFRKTGAGPIIGKIQELTGLRKDGLEFPIELSVSALRWRDTWNAMAIIRDITERRKLEQQFMQSQKMEAVGTLAGGIAHDFNNMLAGIMGPLSLMKYRMDQEREITRDELKRFVDVMGDSGNRAADIVQHLLTLTRRREMTTSPVDLNSVIEHVMKICATALDKSIEMEARYHENRAMTLGDEIQLEQVILNLCINAGHAMTIMRGPGENQGGRLTLEISSFGADSRFRAVHSRPEEGEYWRISVMDTGVGMDARTMACIFDPFFTTKERGMGTGLGLAMVYNSVKQHNGIIDVYSEPGKGTTMNVFLPVYSGVVDVKTRTGEEVIPHGTGLILVVDDEESVRAVARSILEECGYNVIVAGDGEEGVRIFRKEHPGISLVLLDMVMPRKSGREAFLEMRDVDPGVRVLLASGFRLDGRVEDVINLGVRGFIQKPYSLKKLADAVHQILSTT